MPRVRLTLRSNVEMLDIDMEHRLSASRAEADWGRSCVGDFLSPTWWRGSDGAGARRARRPPPVLRLRDPSLARENLFVLECV